jgi:hypothetical protein
MNTLSNNNEVAATFGPAKHWPQPIFLAEAWRSADGTLVFACTPRAPQDNAQKGDLS